MKFLVITKANSPIPPEMALGLFEALSAWATEHVSSGKIEQTWSFAALQGGGGIFNVESLEELDAIMTKFPLAPFSSTELYPLVELQPSLQRVREAIQAMMPPR
jgi:muconolactone delta-isomerase